MIAFGTGSRFRPIAFLARGGSGDIYIVEDLKDKTVRILKVLDPQRTSLCFQDLVLQMKSLAKLSHLLVLKPIELIQTPVVCVLFEFVKGGCLRGLIEEKRGFSFEDAGIFLFQMAQVLEYLHSCDVIHRDIKPDNFLVSQNNRLYLTDFDSAHFQKSWVRNLFLPKKHLQTGTSMYMSPEHMRGGVPCRQMDVYSLATSFYEMITLQYPFGDCLKARENLQNYIPVYFLCARQNQVIRQALHPQKSKRLYSALEFYHLLYCSARDFTS